MLFALSIVLLSIIWVLSIPVCVKLNVDTEATRKWRVQLQWLYGILKIDLTSDDSATLKKTPDRTSTKYAKKKKGKSAKSGGRFFFAMLRSPGFVARLLRLLGDCIRAFEMRQSHLYLRFGLHDPADTGLCMGFIAPLFSYLQNGPMPQAAYDTDYEDAVFLLKTGTTIRFVPLSYVAAIIRFIFSREVFRGVQAGIKASHA